MRVLQLNPNHEGDNYWDLNLVKLICSQIEDTSHVIVIPGAYQGELIEQINQELQLYHYCVVIVTSDEENRFPTGQLDHPRMRVWLQYHQGQNVHRYVPIGPPPGDYKVGPKIMKWMFAGQVNHPGRQGLVAELESRDDQQSGLVCGTEGFTQGYDQSIYRALLSQAMIAPCPGGWLSPDSFRLYEALEMGCIPVVENAGFFVDMFGEFPFLTVNDWSEIHAVIDEHAYDFALAYDCHYWWEERKRIYVTDLENDLWDLSLRS